MILVVGYASPSMPLTLDGITYLDPVSQIHHLSVLGGRPPVTSYNLASSWSLYLDSPGGFYMTLNTHVAVSSCRFM